MKKLPLFIIACLLVSVTTWAGWKKPEVSASKIYLVSKVSAPISCSADGKTVYLSVLARLGDGETYSVVLYKSTDGGETWSEQVMQPACDWTK